MPDRLLTGEPTTKHYRALLAAFAAVVLVLVIGSLVILLTIASQNNVNGKRLIDCTTPGHACYEKGQKQTAQAVGLLSATNIASIACADAQGQQSYLEIQQCVQRTLFKAGLIEVPK